MSRNRAFLLIFPSVVMLSGVMLSGVMLSGVMLSGIMLSGVMLSGEIYSQSQSIAPWCSVYLHMLDVDVLQRTFSSQRRNLRVYTLLFVLWTCAVRLRLVVRLFCLMLVVRLFCLMVVVRLFCLMLVVRLFCLMAVVRLFFLGGFLEVFCNFFFFSSSRCAAPPRKVAQPLSKAVLRSAEGVRFSVAGFASWWL
jgi:hypothetical protein